MKIVCDSCGAKYAIADEKVRGKVFKIRCKKCSNVIVVRGTSGESDAAEERPSQADMRTYGYDEAEAPDAASGEAVWHLVIDQDQIGPITEQEVRQRFARGGVDLETYAWREGFGDWTPLGSLDVFADLASGGGAGVADAGAADPDRATQADPFAAAGDHGDGDLFGAGGMDRAGDGLFAGAADGGGADRRMRGERNENSVLFSLNNLAALASDAPSRPVAAPASSAGMAQVGGSEGSGLIDIRSMAQTYLGGSRDNNRGSAGAANPLGSFSAIEPVGFAAQPPVLLPPTPMGGGSSNKTLYALVGGLGALLVAGVVVVALLVLKDDPPAVAVQAPAGETNGPADTPPDKGTETDTKPGATGQTGQTGQAADQADGTQPTPPENGTANAAAGSAAATNEAKPPENTGSERGTRPRSGSGRREEPSRGSSSKPDKNGSGSSGSSRDKPDTGSGGGGGCLDEVGCLLADKPPACCSKYSGGGGGGSRRGGGSSGGNSNLPEKLTRGDITDGINKVRSSVQGCKSKGSGQVKVTVKVAGSGSVGSVSVKSAPNAALGTCVANAVKKAKFAKTQDGATFTYPFVF